MTFSFFTLAFPQQLNSSCYVIVNLLCSIVLCHIISTLFNSATSQANLLRWQFAANHLIIRSAEKVIGCNLPSLQDLFASRTLRRAGKIVADPSHPGHKLFVVLPSGRRLRPIRNKTSRHKTSFFPAAVGLINKARDPHLTWTLIPPPHPKSVLH